MSTPSEEQEPAYVYRRVHPAQFDSKHQRVKQKCFGLRPHEEGSSVFDARQVNARSTLQSFIDETKQRSLSTDDTQRANAVKNLQEFPDVETMIAKGWHVIKIPVSEIKGRGFSLSDTEPNGHLEIKGTPEKFTDNEQYFTQLAVEGIALLLSAEECLKLDQDERK